MSSDARAAAGAPITFTWQGKQYTLAPLTYGMYGEISAAIASKKLGVLDRVAASLGKFPPSLHASLIDSAVKQAAISDGVKPEEYQSFMSSPEGLPLVLWLMLRGAHPEVTREGVPGLFADMPVQMLQALIVQASGQADAKN